jgi:hypothetical protein
MLNAPQNDLEHERFMLRTELGDAVSPLTQTDGLGWMTDGQWKAFYEQLLKFDALPGPLDYRTAYTDQFLKAVYFESKVLWP